MSQIGQYLAGSPLISLQTLTGNSGGAVPPIANNINVVGAGPINVVGNPGTATLTIDSDGTLAITYTADSGSATPAADNLNVLGGSNISTAGAGSTLSIRVSGTTEHAVQIGSVTNALTSLAVGTDGQVLIGATGADPAFATLTSTGGTIDFTPGANTLNLETAAEVATSYTCDSGSAVPALGVLQVVGGTNITTSGATNVITINASPDLDLNYTAVNTTPYVVLATDQYLGVDCSGAPITIELENAPSTGRVVVIKDSTGSANSNNITVTTVSGAINIDGATSYTMNTQYAAIQVIFNGTSYEIF